jgi:hypothetical protein
LHQSDNEAWDGDDVGSVSHITFFSPGCLITWWNHLIVWTTYDLGNTIFPTGLIKNFCITDDVINIIILNYLLVEQAVVHSAAAIHKSERNSMDFNPNEKFQVGWDNTQYITKLYHNKDQSILDPRNTLNLLSQ